MESKWVAKWFHIITCRSIQRTKCRNECRACGNGASHLDHFMPIMSTSRAWQEFVIDRNSPVRTKDFRIQYMNQSRQEHSIQRMLPWLQQVDCIDNRIKNFRAQMVSSLNTISNKETKARGRILGYMIQLWMKSPCPSPHCSTFFRRPARLCFHCIGHADNRNGKHTTGKGRKQLHTSVAKPGLLSDKWFFQAVVPSQCSRRGLEHFLVAVAPKARKKGLVPVRHQHPSWIWECLGAMNRMIRMLASLRWQFL